LPGEEKMKNSFFVLSGLLLVATVAGQDAGNHVYTQEWGKISKDELAMTAIEEDPEADAVVLFDKGEIITTSDLTMIYKRYRRMKILTENGKKYADVKIYYGHEDNIWDLRAQTISATGQKTKVDKNAIYEQRHEDWKVKVFAIPGVEVGSVIEYSYDIHSEYIHYLEPWYFQNVEYTYLSEVKVVLTDGLNFRSFQENLNLYNPVFTEGQEMDVNKRAKKVSTFTWKLTNVPALKSEPFMFNREDYLAKIHFQLVSFKNEYVNYTFIKTWDDMAKRITERYKDFLAADADLKEVATALIKADSSTNTKIQNIYDYVSSQIETEDENRLFGEDFKKPAEVHETKKGNPVEKNLLLLNLLQNAGFQTHPVLISSRGHGKLSPDFPTLLQFDYLLAAVQQDEKLIFLDTRDKYCPYGMLPEQSLVRQGFLVDETKGSIITIAHTKRQNQIEITSAVKLEAEGKIILTANLGYSGYSAIEERHNLNESGGQDYLQKKINELFVGAKIDSCLITDLNNIYKPLSIWMQITIPDYFQRSDNLIYFSPPYLSKTKSNPFKSQKRYFPVDYPYSVTYNEKIKIEVPAGYTLSEEAPKFKLSFQNISFSLFSFSAEKELEVQRVFKIYNQSFMPAEYKNLRQLYDEMVATDQKQIILNTK
jgi:hypothetical protein